MNKQEIQKEIDNAVRIFRETLEKSYLDTGKPFYGIGVHGSIEAALCGKISVQRLNNKNLKISGELKRDCFNEKCTGMPMKWDDWDIRPVVITLFNKKFDNQENCE